MKINKLRNRIEQYKGKQKQLSSTVKRLRMEVKQLKDSLHAHEQAREIVKEVGLKTQQMLQFHIADLTSLALQAVFPDPYELRVDFVHRRNKVECDLYFVRDGNEIEPLESSGYGAVDVAALALRVASWSMKQPRARNTIILDEPMRFLSTDYQPQASKMLAEISSKLGIQFIIITHEEVLTEYADKVFHVRLKTNKAGDKIAEVL